VIARVNDPMVGMMIRRARADEAPLVARMIRHMVEDMAGHGGHTPAREDSAWSEIADRMARELGDDKYRYLMAEAPSGDTVGAAGGELITLGGAFAPKRMLHVSMVYVRPAFRQRGIAGRLLTDLITWGRDAGAQHCELNVLASNPAMALYQKHGFANFEIKMVRQLRGSS
jgi:GNAT superfamily N-acetyltransferase